MFVGNRAVKEFSESGCKFVHLSHYFCAGKKYLLHLDCNDHLPFKVVCDPTDTRLTVQPHISSLGTSECTQVFFFQPLPLGDHLPQTHHLTPNLCSSTNLFCCLHFSTSTIPPLHKSKHYTRSHLSFCQKSPLTCLHPLLSDSSLLLCTFHCFG